MFNLFKKTLKPCPVIQTGLIWEGIGETDHVLGVTPSIVTPILNSKGNWDSLVTKYEPQSVQYIFDTFACVSFSACKESVMVLSALIEQKFFSDTQLNWLKSAGYFDETGKLNFSERFTSIMSGTTPNGNTMQNVWNSIRNDGLLPDQDLPFGGTDFYSFHDKSLVTEEMKIKARKFKDEIAKAAYAWVFVMYEKGVSKEARTLAQDALLYAPLQIGIKYPAYHAITMTSIGSTKANLADHYEPYQYAYKLSEGIHMAMKGSFTVQTMKTYDYPEYQFNKNLSQGMMNDPDVKIFQKILILEGFLKAGLTTGNFLSATQGAAVQWQLSHGLVGDGKIGPKSRAVLNVLCKKKT